MDQDGSNNDDGEKTPIQTAPSPPTSGALTPVSEQAIRSGVVNHQYRQEMERAEQVVARSAADAALIASLRQQGFTGRAFDRFNDELASYGIGVMRGWLHSGYAFTATATRGKDLHPSDREREDLTFDAETRHELADMTVARALPRFREQALVEGGWRPDKGASITTYFIGACTLVLPNEFRRWRTQRLRWGQGVQTAEDLARRERTDSVITDAGTLAIGRQRVLDDLSRLSPRTQAVVALRLDDYSEAEIAEMLGTTERAVEGILHRWRKQEQKRMREETL